jgi:hypothetical protein
MRVRKAFTSGTKGVGGGIGRLANVLFVLLDSVHMHFVTGEKREDSDRELGFARSRDCIAGQISVLST